MKIEKCKMSGRVVCFSDGSREEQHPEFWISILGFWILNLKFLILDLGFIKDEGGGNRTHDSRLKRPLLYRLSYTLTGVYLYRKFGRRKDKHLRRVVNTKIGITRYMYRKRFLTPIPYLTFSYFCSHPPFYSYSPSLLLPFSFALTPTKGVPKFTNNLHFYKMTFS